MGLRSFKLQIEKEKMVSLESRLTYLEAITNNKKINAFYLLLNNKNINNQELEYLSQIDKIYFHVAAAISDDNKNQFTVYYNELIVRQPGKDSPFIHDDYFIFILLVGVIKFNIDVSWIKSVLEQRAATSVTTTFKNIINTNFNDNRNLKEIILSYKYLVKETSFDKRYLDETYLSITSNINLFNEKNDFLILTSLKALDVIILYNDPPDIKEFSFLKSFEVKFVNRTQILSASIYFICLGLLTYLCVVLISDYEWVNQLMQKVVTVLALVLLGLPYSLKKVREWLEKKVRKTLGYSK